VPNDLAHPAPEQLAAYAAGEAGDLDRAGIATHLAACQACSTEAAAIEAVTGELAALAEPDLPPGFHDRLVAAVQAEIDTPQPVPVDAGGTGDAAASPAREEAEPRPVPGPKPRPVPGPKPRPVPGPDLGAARDRRDARRRRLGVAVRPLAWGAAAAVILFIAVVGVAQLSDLTSEEGGGTAGGGEVATAPAAPEYAAGPLAAGEVPLFRLPGELDPAQLREAVSTRPDLQAAYRTAAGTAVADSEQRSKSAPSAGGTSAAAKAPPGLQACLAAVAPGARPAFFVEGAYQGRPATVLVAAEAQGGLGLYVFARGDCTRLLSRDSGPPPAT
jgi:anti-sigma factor RsiW